MIYTTIQVSVNTRERLARLKSCMKGTYDELLSTLLDFVPSGDDEGEYTSEFRASMIRSLADIKHGRTYSINEVRERLGIA